MLYQKKPGRWRAVLAVVLLAIVCIGGMELVVCRFADPALYLRLTAPVRTGIAQAGHFVQTSAQSAAERVHLFFNPPEPEPEPPPEEQLATRPQLVSDTPAADPVITALEVADGVETLTGGATELVYYNQGDEQWKSLPYGYDNIGGYGCGPTAMAMVVSSVTDEPMNPAEMAAWAAKHGYYARGGGSYLSIVPGTAEAWGLTCESLPDCSADRLMQELMSGKVAVALMRAGHFTQRGHFILLHGISYDGNILVADPNSRELSLQTWPAELILDELSTGRSNGAPLWFISPYTALG